MNLCVFEIQLSSRSGPVVRVTSSKYFFCYDSKYLGRVDTEYLNFKIKLLAIAYLVDSVAIILWFVPQRPEYLFNIT